MLEQLILIGHVLIAVAITGLILLQQGKGADAGASFGGGASQTVFGSSGSGNFLSRSTAVLAALFFVTSFGLTIVAKDRLSGGEFNFEAAAETVAPAVEVPAVESSNDELPFVEEAPVADEELPAVEAEEDIPQVEDQAAAEASTNEDIPAKPAE